LAYTCYIAIKKQKGSTGIAKAKDGGCRHLIVICTRQDSRQRNGLFARIGRTSCRLDLVTSPRYYTGWKPWTVCPLTRCLQWSDAGHGWQYRSI